MASKDSLSKQTGRIGAVQQFMTLIGADDDDKKKFNKYYATEEYPLINEEGRETPASFHESYLANMKGYYKERGIKPPKHHSSLSAYLEHRQGEGKRGGGTRMPKKHIMELPTNSSQKRRK